MRALWDRSTGVRRRASAPWLLLLAAVVLAGGGGAAYAWVGGGNARVSCSKGVVCTGSSKATGRTKKPSTDAAQTFAVASTTPANGATGVGSDTTVTVQFTSAVDPNGPMPTLSPQVTGTWTASGDELVFSPSGPFVPFETYTVTVPGGQSGVRSVSGAHLRAATSAVSFTIAQGSTVRLDQLLAELGYLPLSYQAPPPPGRDMAIPQAGTLTWRWSTLPAQLTSQWVNGGQNPILKGAVMMFETENGLTVDGIAGPKVWAALLADAAAHKTSTESLTYVLVTKVLPEHLTAWVTGTLKFHDIPCNTGVPGATTADGTFQVFEHVRASDMKGCDVTGTCYNDPTVPWASYFDGGEALHGFPRATYGWPQSNGCVEMKITTAGALWPYTPIGTVVAVQGPTATPASTTTTTTTSPTTTTTTTSTTTTTTTSPAPASSTGG